MSPSFFLEISINFSLSIFRFSFKFISFRTLKIVTWLNALNPIRLLFFLIVFNFLSHGSVTVITIGKTLWSITEDKVANPPLSDIPLNASTSSINISLFFPKRLFCFTAFRILDSIRFWFLKSEAFISTNSRSFSSASMQTAFVFPVPVFPYTIIAFPGL